MKKGFVPKNTSKQTDWEVRVFKDWIKESNPENDTTKCPADLLELGDAEKLNIWLARFVAEVRNAKGLPYPLKTIQNLLSGLQRHVLEVNPSTAKFLDRNNVVYRDFHRACDSVYHDLHKSGVETNVSHAKVITREEEDRLWDSGIFCIATPKGLQNAFFFYAGKHFCLRGGEEQRGLSPAQFTRTSNPDGYKYIEHGSKNRSGGLGY